MRWTMALDIVAGLGRTAALPNTALDSQAIAEDRTHSGGQDCFARQAAEAQCEAGSQACSYPRHASKGQSLGYLMVMSACFFYLTPLPAFATAYRIEPRP